MLRVLNIMGSLQLGGLETTVMHHYRHIDREKVQFDFLLNEAPGSYYEEEAAALGANIYRRTRRAKNPMACQNELLCILRQNPEIQIVHIHGEEPVMGLDARTARKAGVKVRMTHSRSALPHIGFVKKLFRPMLLKNATHWLACSTEAGVSLYGKNAKSRVILLNNARPLSPFFYNPVIRAEVKKELGLTTELVLVNVGRLHMQKNQLFLLEVFAEIYKENPSTVLLLAGDGKEMHALQQRAKQLSIEQNVRFLGRCNQVERLLQAADIFMLPSVNEGLPGSAIEAQAAGLPCLVSDTVTKECDITQRVQFLPIDKGAGCWAEAVHNMRSNLPDRDVKQVIEQSGYEIQEAADRLQKMYFAALEEAKEQH